MEQDLSSEANLHDLHLFCSYLLYIIYKKRTPVTTADEFLTGAFYFYMKAFIVKLNNLEQFTATELSIEGVRGIKS